MIFGYIELCFQILQLEVLGIMAVNVGDNGFDRTFELIGATKAGEWEGIEQNIKIGN